MKTKSLIKAESAYKILRLLALSGNYPKAVLPSGMAEYVKTSIEDLFYAENLDMQISRIEQSQISPHLKKAKTMFLQYSTIEEVEDFKSDMVKLLRVDNTKNVSGEMLHTQIFDTNINI